MKKFFVNLMIIFFILILDTLLSKIFPFYFRPNLWLVYIVFVSLFLGHTDAVILGFFAGIIYDILHLTLFGVNTLLLTTTGYLFGCLNRRVNENLYNVQILCLLMSFIIYYGLYFITSLLFESTGYNLIYLLSIIPTLVIGFLELQLLVLLYKKYNLV